MKTMIMAMLLLLAAATLLAAEDYQCGSDAGCVGRITEDGEIREETFRKGDMISTDAGWWIVTDDGWVKVKTGKRVGGSGRLPKLGFVIGEVTLWVDHVAIPTGVYTALVPQTGGLFLRPVVSLASQETLPLSTALIGLF